MIQEYIRNNQFVPTWIHSKSQDRNVEVEEILRVLMRAADDDEYIAQLTEQASKALQEYHLSQEAKAALVSGDIRWIEARVGKLGAHMRTWLDCRLQQEIW